MKNTEWSEMSNSEIEVKLKEQEFEYEKTKNEIYRLCDYLDSLNSNYNKGKLVIEKRINPNKIDWR